MKPRHCGKAWDSVRRSFIDTQVGVRENRRRTILVAKTIRLTALVVTLAIGFAQTPAPPANTVIRIDVNLVQVDSVVTDSHGKRVSDLQASDFALWQDGKPQEITNFTYVTGKPAAATAQSVAPTKKIKGEVPPPPPVLEPAEVHRTLALVVDEQGVAAENIGAIRTSIRKFLDEQMRPGDLVAIVRTGAGMGALQQFTTDKRLLYAALDRIKYGESRVGVSSFTPLGQQGGRATAAINHQREESLAVGSLGAIRFVVNQMRGLPGRKSLILFTENIRMIYRNTTDEMITAAVQELSDAASRASVVIHAIDPRGMPDYSVNAADNTSRMSSRRVSRVPAQREQEVINTEQGMFALAEATGGLFLHDANDLSAALRKLADDSDGYYLIGYHPDAGTFENKDGQPRFHKIEVKVKRAGLHVRSREGFFGEPGGDTPMEHSREVELSRAMQSPFAAGALHPRLTAIFSNLPQTGSVIDTMFAFNPKELKWSTEPDGSRKAQVDVAAETFDEDGVALSTVNTSFSLQMKPEQYDAAVRRGLFYGIRVPVKKPGPYLIRAALRDPATEGTGGAEQFVEVPDVEAGRLALSSIFLQDAAVSVNADLTENGGLRQDGTGGIARRNFRRGEVLTYAIEILNAQFDAAKKPELDVQTRLFREGQQVLTSQTTIGGDATRADPRRLLAGGRMTLGSQLTPGTYVLQVVVTDKLAKGKSTPAVQSMDFRIEP